MRHPDEYIIVLVCDDIPNQKFWDDVKCDWTADLESSTGFQTYGKAGQKMWSIPVDKVTHRVTTIPFGIYERLLRGETV
ncbi:MAG: hypothetical protein WC895_04635 [Candidatus Shapirobacteria bacterium]|jgi:hypothetical protein